MVKYLKKKKEEMNQQYMFKILNAWEDCAVNDISMPHQCHTNAPMEEWI